MTREEFDIFYKNMSRSETRSEAITADHSRQRIPRFVFAGMMQNGRWKEAATLYESVHGETQGVMDDFRVLSGIWGKQSEEQNNQAIGRLWTKYNNQRAYKVSRERSISKTTSSHSISSKETLEASNDSEDDEDDPNEEVYKIDMAIMPVSTCAAAAAPSPITISIKSANPSTSISTTSKPSMPSAPSLFSSLYSADVHLPAEQAIQDITPQEHYMLNKPAVEDHIQWKTEQIYRAIRQNCDNQYKTYCEASNTLGPNWETEWITFVLAVKSTEFAEASKIIHDFVENLRRIRHNKLCEKDHVARTNRQQWPAHSVIRAFLDGRIALFKAHTEASTGDKPDDPKWITRWNEFIASLEGNRTDESKMKAICSKFMSAQRVKRYRRKKGSDTSSITDSIPESE